MKARVARRRLAISLNEPSSGGKELNRSEDVVAMAGVVVPVSSDAKAPKLVLNEGSSLTAALKVGTRHGTKMGLADKYSDPR